MKIVTIVAKSYVGATPAGGAETYLHDCLKFLAGQGHDVTVFLSGRGTPTEVDGVKLRSHIDRGELGTQVADCDLILTHLDGTPLAQSFGTRYDKPVAQIIHNTNEFTEGFLAYGCDYAIYNSKWVSEYHENLTRGPMTRYWTEKGRTSLQLRRCTSWPSMVLRPPVNIDDYRLTLTDPPGPVDGYITLVNPCNNKGQHIFYELARRCPDLQFMSVVGGYQPNKQVFKDLPNVVKHEHVKDMKEIFSKTAIVLMPSTYESYGRVAVEAACSGIPSVVSSTPGLVEAMGDGASYVSPVEAGDYSTIEDWEKALRYVLNDYNFCSTMAKKRATELSSSSFNALKTLEKNLLGLVKSWGSAQ